MCGLLPLPLFLRQVRALARTCLRNSNAPFPNASDGRKHAAARVVTRSTSDSIRRIAADLQLWGCQPAPRHRPGAFSGHPSYARHGRAYSCCVQQEFWCSWFLLARSGQALCRSARGRADEQHMLRSSVREGVGQAVRAVVSRAQITGRMLCER